MRYTALSALAVAAALAAAGCATTADQSSSTKQPAAEHKSDKAPRVAFGQTVRVDALIWDAVSVRTAKTLGDNEFGTGATADGMFVIVRLKVHSDRNQSADLSSAGDHDLVELVGGGTTTKPSIEGETAYEMAHDGGGTLDFTASISPDADKSGTVVFDVPESRLNGSLSLRFAELGFGSGHGFIRLPATTPSS
jgi:hypothetical protein